METLASGKTEDVKTKLSCGHTYSIDYIQKYCSNRIKPFCHAINCPDTTCRKKIKLRFICRLFDGQKESYMYQASLFANRMIYRNKECIYFCQKCENTFLGTKNVEAICLNCKNEGIEGSTLSLPELIKRKEVPLSTDAKIAADMVDKVFIQLMDSFAK